MFNMGSAPSLSDIAAVTKDGNGDGWGNGNGWWVLIILFAIFGGWGNGWGGQGRNGEGCATNGDLQRGFDTQSILNKPVSTYGAAYDSWSDARKHYTKTGSSEDKERMERHGEEHVEKAIISMRDIWSEASPELKRRMKTELSTLVDGMSI